MRILALSLAILTPAIAIAETAEVLSPPPVAPAVEARLVPAVIPGADEIETLDEWEPTPTQIAAIVGPDGALRGSYMMAETFDDAPMDEDGALIQAVFDEM